ncbi:MAG: hypothetical protein OXS50_13670, partial [Gammaproteobacteria bacterium]|nr:hypothetical protein [Gammaproteobacteria bacterium]
EDFRKDQYILAPLFRQLFRSLGSTQARVTVCQDPLLGGVSEALKSKRLEEVVERYRMADMLILCVDRDGEAGRRQRLDQIEAEFGKQRAFLAENAWEEVETWALAGLDLPTEWSWSAVRAEVNVKEVYFDALARLRGVATGPGGGRKRLGEEAARRLGAIRQKCVEDFDRLALQIQAELAAR